MEAERDRVCGREDHDHERQLALSRMSIAHGSVRVHRRRLWEETTSSLRAIGLRHFQVETDGLDVTSVIWRWYHGAPARGRR